LVLIIDDIELQSIIKKEVEFEFELILLNQDRLSTGTSTGKEAPGIQKLKISDLIEENFKIIPFNKNPPDLVGEILFTVKKYPKYIAVNSSYNQTYSPKIIYNRWWKTRLYDKGSDVLIEDIVLELVFQYSFFSNIINNRTSDDGIEKEIFPNEKIVKILSEEIIKFNSFNILFCESSEPWVLRIISGFIMALQFTAMIFILLASNFQDVVLQSNSNLYVFKIVFSPLISIYLASTVSQCLSDKLSERISSYF
jgi:hypothetical protein